MNLAYMHRRNAKLYPDKPAIIYGERRVTFGQLEDRINRLVNVLHAKGVKKGDRIAILAKNCIEYFEVYGSAEKGGPIIVPLNFRLQPHELAHLLNDCGACVLFVEAEYVDVIESIRPQIPFVKHFIAIRSDAPGYENYESLLSAASAEDALVEIGDDDVAYIIYTSGTTGLPRGAMLTHRGQAQDARAMTLELGIVPNDVYLGVMPFYHIGGRALALSHFYRGCTNVVMRDFDPEGLLRLIQAERVTCVQVVPTMIAFALDLPNVRDFDLSCLRTIFYASAPMPVALLGRAIETFGPIFFQAYGQTESGPLLTVLRKDDHLPDGSEAEVKRLGSCGIPVLDADVRVLNDDGRDVSPGEVGEISARSEWIMVGYWGKPDMTAQTVRDGWLYTGDMATVDEGGYIYIVDRKKDMIISGGENIYPREIEEVLYRHPAVLEAAVIGTPDERWGEAVKALVVLKSGATATEAEIIEHCKINLASYKKPKSVEFVESLPKTPTGKILKRELREKYWQGHERRV
ncbi:MAG: long-chain-fatty-acid--CoA ligase [Chloroflexi bacterium]|nr:long-chain-fatty-acid--CoA ligase [Chloroflexota bacterium]MDA8188054.1 long-chain-fatty-acid--CoA ligase [Dehalococcoidales bacterium]